jgi:hypothetical protein
MLSAAAAAQQVQPPPTPPAAKPRGPYFKQLTVAGPVTAATIQHLEQLLDLLPGTQHLEEVVLQDNIKQLSFYRDVWTSLLEPHPRRLFGIMPQPQSNSSSRSRASRLPPSTCSSSSSWRSSCDSLAIAAPFWEAEDPTYTGPGLDALQPLLGSLQQPRALFMAGVSLAALPEYVTRLGSLQALHVAATLTLSEQVVASMAALTNLRHLGMMACVDPITTIAAAFSNLVHLSSLEFTANTLTPQVLEGVCSITTLRQLNLMHTAGYTSLPDSISKLVGLRVLWMQSTPVSSLPEGMTALTELGMLKWSCRNGAVPLDLDMVWRLRSLHLLKIEDDHLAALPEAVSQLTDLLVLTVRSKALAAVPDALGTLPELVSLHLQAPRLHMLPEGITALTQLKQLSAPGARLRKQSPAVRAFLAGCQVLGGRCELARDSVWSKLW